MNKTVLIILLLTLVTFCLAANSNTVRAEADIRGKITKIRRASGEEERRMIGTLFVEADDKAAKVDKANLIITDKTRILKEQDGKRVEATFDDLNTGQLVEARFVEGPTIMIYPLQVAAAEIVILKMSQ